MSVTITRYADRGGNRTMAQCNNCGEIILDADSHILAADVAQRIADGHTCPGPRPELRNPTGVVVTFDPSSPLPHVPGEKGSRILWKGHEYIPAPKAPKEGATDDSPQL